MNEISEWEFERNKQRKVCVCANLTKSVQLQERDTPTREKPKLSD